MSQHVVQVANIVSANPKIVWKALTTPESLKTYFFGTDVETDWKVGSDVRFHGEWKGKKYTDKGQIECFKPEEQLSFTHWSAMSGNEDKPENYHTVTFDLEPVSNGTKVTLSQDNADNSEPVSDKAREEFTKNWQMMLDGLKKTVERH